MTFPTADDPRRRDFMEGYRVGELERIALATANSELRSLLRGLQPERDRGGS